MLIFHAMLFSTDFEIESDSKLLKFNSKTDKLSQIVNISLKTSG